MMWKQQEPKSRPSSAPTEASSSTAIENPSSFVLSLEFVTGFKHELAQNYRYRKSTFKGHIFLLAFLIFLPLNDYK